MPSKKTSGSKTSKHRKSSKKQYYGSKTSKPLQKENDKEVWKSFPHKILKDKLEVSNKGRVRNKITGNILSQQIKNNYYYYNTVIDEKWKSFRVNRLVAILYVKNPKPKRYNKVNHLDGNKLNNHYNNLEWTTTGGNNQHAADTGLTSKTKRRVSQYVGTHLFAEYDSVSAAQEATGYHMSRIVEVCKGQREEYDGFVWKYTDVNPNEKVIDPEAEGYKNVETFPNYWISNTGLVYSKPFKKIMKQNKHPTGCMQIQLSRRNPKGKGQIKKTVLVHNLVAAYFMKKPPKNCNCVHHIDGDRTNNNVDNLKWKYVGGVQFTKI